MSKNAYTYKEAATALRCEQIYVRQLVAKGKIHEVGDEVVKGKVTRKLLSATDVDAYAMIKRDGVSDGAHTYKMRLDDAQLAAIRALYPSLEISDETERMKAYRASRADNDDEA